jgi:hypothetical protein
LTKRIGVRMKWREYPPDILHKDADKFEQCNIYKENDRLVSLNLYTYGSAQQLEIYMDGAGSPIGKTVRIVCYTYHDVGKEEIEADANKLLKLLGK